MPGDVFKPFNEDVIRLGGYEYTRTDRLSCKYANLRTSRIIMEIGDLDGKDVVDVGCGDGNFTAELRRETKAAYILGIDPAACAIEVAERLHVRYDDRLEFRSCRALDLVREGIYFDIAICRGVIHHVENPQREIATVLQLADKAIFIDPNGYNLALKLLERFSPYHLAHKERSYRIEQFRKWIIKGGGKVELSLWHGLVPMFAPEWAVILLSRLEPIVESLPFVRRFMCGRIAILATCQDGNSSSFKGGNNDSHEN